MTAEPTARQQTAAQWAVAQAVAVRDDPAARRELIVRTYDGPTGRAPQHAPFRRAHLAFVDWQLRRGVLRPLDGPRPGSPWWRAVNERLTRDGCEAIAHAAGRGGPVSSRSVERWLAFVEVASAERWYRAHNASIVGGYLNHLDLATQEDETERFFLNVVLLRVLYAHAMCANPRLALGWLGRLTPLLGDPRLRTTGLFLSLAHTLPDAYPFEVDIATSLRRENPFARTIDYGVIGPRLAALYAWSAEVLDEPRLLELIDGDSPRYAITVPRDLWHPAVPSRPARLVRALAPA